VIPNNTTSHQKYGYIETTATLLQRGEPE